MRVDARVEQLNVYSYFVSSFLHAAFQQTGDAEFTGHCLQVFRRAFVFGCRFSRDNLQVADGSELRQDLILNTVGEVSIVWVTAQIVEWQNRDALLQR